MLPASLATQSVVRLRAGVVTDGYGDDVADWSSPTSQTISGCLLTPVQGGEFLQARDAVVTRWQWFGPADADVTSADRLQYADATYEVDGSVEDWPDPTGSGLAYRSCYLRRSDG